MAVATKTTKARYIEAVGRRKTAIARVRLFENQKGVTVNGMPLGDYFKTATQKMNANGAFTLMGLEADYGGTAKVLGGGLNAQSEALRHAVSRALIKINIEWRNKLKRAGYLKRDPRAVERKKYGLKKARKSPQWSKR